MSFGIFARSMSSGDYLAGVAYFLATLGPAVAAAMIVIRKRYGYLAGLPRTLATATFATAALVLAAVMPAAVGALTRSTLVATALLLLIAAWVLKPVRAEPAPAFEPDPPPSRRVSLAIAALAIASVGVYELARVRELINQPITNIDMLAFHLPGVARFIQTGTLWQVNQFLPGFATAQYPNNGDFIILSTILPWHDFAFSRLPALFFFGLTGLAVYAVALELGSSRAAASTFAAVALIIPAFSIPALGGLPDAVTVSLLAVGVLFILRHTRSGRRGELVLAGLAIGLSLGTKWFGLTDAVVLIAIWILARLLSRTSRVGICRDLGVMSVTMALGGGIWLVRNLIESGNPIYPKAVSIFGIHIFSGSRNDVIDRFGYTILDYLGKPGILRRYVYPGFKIETGIGGAVLLIGVLITIAWGVTRLHSYRQGVIQPARITALALAVLGFCLVYAVTPGSAYGTKDLPVEGFVNIRWLTPGVALAAATCAFIASSTGGWGILLELGGLAAIADGIKLGPSVDTGSIITVGLVAFAVAATVLAMRRWTRPWRGCLRPAIVLVIAAVAVIAGGRADERSFDKGFYKAYDPVLGWIGAHAPSGHRIGFTGGVGKNALADITPAFGPRLGNQVTYVGDVVRHSLEVPASIESFRSELGSGRYDLLLIQLQYAGRTDTWARALGYRPLVRSAALALYDQPSGNGT